MYILGIDPWIRKIGYALIDLNLNIYQAGILVDEFNKERETQFERLIKISNFFDNLLKNYNIKYVGIEKLYFTQYNQSNAEFVYSIRWILIEKMIKKNIKIYEYSPTQLKKYITWNWRASKKLIVDIISKIFKLSNQIEFHDAADALWLCYLVYKKLG